MKRLKRKRRGEGWNELRETQKNKKKSDVLDSAPHPPSNTPSVWLAAQSPGSKVRGKVSFVLSIPLVCLQTQ